MATETKTNYDVYFERLQACERLQDLDAIRHDFHEAMVKDVRENEFPMKYADLERQRKEELTAIHQKFEMAVKPLEHKLVPAYNDEYREVYSEFESNMTKHLDNMTEHLNALYNEIDSLLADQKQAVEMSKRIEIYRYRNYPVDGRRIDGMRLPFGRLNIDGDTQTDQNRKTLKMIVHKYLQIRQPAHDVPKGELAKLRPDPMYFVQKATK